MKDGEIYQFEDPREIFVHVFHEKSKKNPLFSIRAWSRKLGFRNPSHVSEVLSGKRNLTVDFGLRVSDSLDFTDDEKTYFEATVFHLNAKGDEEKAFYASVLRKLKPEESKEEFGYEKFPELKEWYYGVLDEMTCLSDFRDDPQYLAKRLSPELTAQAVQIAIRDMLKIGLIEKDGKGKLKRPKKWFIREEENPSKKEHVSVRKYKKKFLEKAIAALDDQQKGESFFRQTNCPMSFRDFPKIVALANSFFESVYELDTSRKADEVFHIGINFYRLTQPHAPQETT